MPRVAIPRPLAAAVTALALAGTLAAAPPLRAPLAPDTVVLLVRHAEKAVEPGNDPSLSVAGEARAKALAEALRDAGVQAIVTTQLKRTRLTAQPLAESLKLTPEVVPAGGAAHADSVAAAVRRHAGHTVLVVGHSNTVPAIIAALGGPKLPDICDAEHANLFVVVIPEGGPARLVRSRYGTADTVAAGACAAMMPAR
ncbi:MAG: histidine phosphatase family protein [Gemmatimonadaceae bacterium]